MIHWASKILFLTLHWPSDGDDPRPLFDRSKLPTAPKAARGPDVDVDRIPDRPPYTAFVGNLAYDVSEEKIAEFFEGRNLEVQCSDLRSVLGGWVFFKNTWAEMQNHAKGVFECIKQEVILAMNCIQHCSAFFSLHWFLLVHALSSILIPWVLVSWENTKSVCEREKTNIFCYLPNFVFYSVVLVLFTCFSNQYHVHEPPSWTWAALMNRSVTLC